MRNNQSTFIKEFGYLIDEFDELQDLRWSDLQYLAEYRELKMKKNDGLSIDQNRLDQLEPLFKNKIVTAPRWNKFQNGLVGMQKFIKDEVEGFVLDKQQEVITTVEDAKNSINTSKDNALIAIENKKENIIHYMDETTAGAIRNDIGVMGDSTIEGRSLIDKTNNLSNLVQQAFQSGIERNNELVANLNSKGVVATNNDNLKVNIERVKEIETDKTGDATATAADILAPKDAYVKGKKITGTIPSKGAQTYTPGITALLIEAGQYLSGRQTIAGVVVPVANVLVGTTIAGQAGTMPNNGAINSNIITQGGQINIPYGYHGQGGKVTANFLNLTPPNIKAGVNVGSVVGTYVSTPTITANTPSGTLPHLSDEINSSASNSTAQDKDYPHAINIFNKGSIDLRFYLRNVGSYERKGTISVYMNGNLVKSIIVNGGDTATDWHAVDVVSGKLSFKFRLNSSAYTQTFYLDKLFWKLNINDFTKPYFEFL